MNSIERARSNMKRDNACKRSTADYVSIYEINGSYCQITRALWDVIVSNNSYPKTWVKAKIYDKIVWSR